MAVPIQWRIRSKGANPKGSPGVAKDITVPLRSVPGPEITWRYICRLTAGYGDKSTSLAGGYPSRPSQGGIPGVDNAS